MCIRDSSLRGAARRVGASQPAITKMVRELELELAAPLLLRTSRGVVPTAQGKVLYDRAVKVDRELTAADSAQARSAASASMASREAKWA